MDEENKRGRRTKDGAEIVERVKITLSLDAHTKAVLESFGGSHSENIRALAHVYDTSDPGMWAGRAQYSGPVPAADPPPAVPRAAAVTRARAVRAGGAVVARRADGLRYSDVEGEAELSIGEQQRRARARL